MAEDVVPVVRHHSAGGLPFLGVLEGNTPTNGDIYSDIPPTHRLSLYVIDSLSQKLAAWISFTLRDLALGEPWEKKNTS